MWIEFNKNLIVDALVHNIKTFAQKWEYDIEDIIFESYSKHTHINKERIVVVIITKEPNMSMVFKKVVFILDLENFVFSVENVINFAYVSPNKSLSFSDV